MLDVSRSLPPDSETRQSDIAFEMLKADIVACRLAPGAGVTEGELAERYRLGKAPIRFALARLADRDWLRALPRRGYRVKPIAMRDVTEVFDLRAIVESAAARMAAGRVEISRLEHLDAVCGAGFVPGDSASEATYLQAHRQFHLAIVLAGGNRRIGRAFEPLWEETERVLHHTGLLRRHPDELRHDHRSLLAALNSGNGAAAEDEMREEIQHLTRIVVDIALKTAILPAPLADAEAERSEDARW
jgi:DNA-binding GntR family transcriptional regulator